MKPIGTFLCRFSDSELGGVTIAWAAEDPKTPGKLLNIIDIICLSNIL